MFSAAHRFMDVDVVPLGNCTNMEAVIFTLSLAWLPLLILHVTVHQYQRLAARERPRFPGTIDDQEIPSGLKWLRMLLFIALCVWPTFCHVFLTGRAFAHYAVIPSGVVSTEPVERWPAIRHASLLAAPFTHPQHPAWDAGGPGWWVNISRAEWQERKAPTADGNAVFDRVMITALPLSPSVFAGLGLLATWSLFVALVNGFTSEPRSFLLRPLKR